MAPEGTRFEVRVGTRISEAMLAAFRLPVRGTVTPGHTLHRLRISADRDVPAVLRRLAESDVEVVELRRFAAPEPRDDAVTQPRHSASPPETAEPGETAVVLPFRRKAGPPPRA